MTTLESIPSDHDDGIAHLTSAVLVLLLVVAHRLCTSCICECTGSDPYPAADFAARYGRWVLQRSQQFSGDYAELAAVGKADLSSAAVATDSVTNRSSAYEDALAVLLKAKGALQALLQCAPAPEEVSFDI